MPLPYLRRLTSRVRSQSANRDLARYLAFVAGGVNAGGFLAVRQYTSHMSGIVSAMADNLALGQLAPVCTGLFSVAAFVFGACCSSLIIRWARRRHLLSEFALPLVVESVLLMAFGLVGRRFQGEVVVSTILLLCFTMGLQNAMITNISGAVIRTTHLTGIMTDIGIECGHMLFSMASPTPRMEQNHGSKLPLLLSLVLLFFIGGVTGALGFKFSGFLFAVPLAGVLFALAIIPILDDLRSTRDNTPAQ